MDKKVKQESEEILFRGFHPDEDGSKTITIDGKQIKGEWVEGQRCTNGKQVWIVYNNDFFEAETVYRKFIQADIFFEVIPETVGQYTNLTDKNGAKIFKGDIVRAGLDEPMHNYEVIFYQCGFKLKSKKCETIYDYSIHDEKYEMEVVGNKWENPELLEEEL